ncbi:MAG: membrane protein insertase YidC, partial [Ectothiorhodospiraceae bacterium]
MENNRLFLFLALGVVLVLIWTAWQEDYGQSPAPKQEQAASAPASGSGTAPEHKAESTGPAPEAPPQDTAEAATEKNASPEPKADAAMREGKVIHVVTDLLDVRISTVGGELVSAKLRKHTISTTDKSPFPLLHDRANSLFVAESGLVAKDADAPDHNTVWKAESTEYRLGEGQEKLVVPLTWTGPDGVTVTKTYTFGRDKYLINLDQKVVNNGGKPWQAYQYVQLRRTPDTGEASFLKNRSYTGGVIYSEQEKYEKIGFDDMEDKALSRDIKDGWAAMIQHYFLAAWVPPRGLTERYFSRVPKKNQYVLGMSSPWQTVAPGKTASFTSDLFVGPKDQDRLAGIAKGLELTVDYGWLTVISKPLFIALSWIHSVVGNWGWAIVILTLCIKLAFYKLSETSYRSMARMRKLQPRMQQLKERF